ncbi:VOC family protein [Aeromicrobium sp. Leaf350]|uniref:bleomycin resistance protein n=1 Tax=Aeromicrobium sp. Leaf350 TaxID=2876565 RepID=UPI001E435C72|nr:VOC family protein [Aeromicrobium sp. Leaf350]
MTTQAVPILRISDVDQALAWWARLGFAEDFRHQFEPGFPWYVGLVRGDAQVHLSQHTGDALGPGLLYLWVEDVDAVAAEFGVPIEDMPWARDCEVTDPDGNRVRVGSTPSSAG